MPLLVVLLLSGGLFLAAGALHADDHGKGKAWADRSKHDDHRSSIKIPGSFAREGKDEGDETSGQITAWLWGAVNLTVALSVVIKGINRFAPLSAHWKSSLTRFNQQQKKLLMRFHYFLNPPIVAVALYHWSSSRCRSTSLPEWGLLIMASLAVLGLVFKLRLCPKTFLKDVYRLHTQPVFFVALITLLLIGHWIVD
jgi:hypothetical protein